MPYATSRSHHMSLMALLNIKQGKGESSHTLMKRLSKFCMCIRYLMPEITMHHLVSAIRPSWFTKILIKRPTKNFDELTNWATKFMYIEELSDFDKSVQSENGRDKRKEKDKGNPSTSGWSEKFRENRGPQFLNYTPLNDARGKIPNEALQVKLIRALKQLQSPRNANMSKHCQYHHNFGHTTEGCQALKDIIKELIQVRHLHKFVRTSTNSYRYPQRERYPSTG